MDNLTHSLIGAVLGQAGLKRKTGLAMPALIIAANLPDIDAPCTFYGVESLAMRRGLTHGPIALLVLPLLLGGGLILFDRWQHKRGKRPPTRLPIHPGWLVALCYLGAFTHPAFDWLNSYGIRLLEPFSSQWFYGDALFIIDPWLWAILIGAVWLSRRRERSGVVDWKRPAQVAVFTVMAYVAMNIGISRFIAGNARMSEPYPEIVVSSPVPFAFWQRQILWRSQGQYGSYVATIPFSRSDASVTATHNMADPRIAAARQSDPKARAFLFWSRMPIAQRSGDKLTLRDQRFMSLPARGGFQVEIAPAK